MARMSIDDKFLRDPRVRRLGAHLGWSRRETMGCLLDVFAITYDRETHLLLPADIDEAAGKQCFADALVCFDLGERVGDLVRVKGAYERIAYLDKRREAGRLGGINSGKSRRNQSEAKRSTASSTAKRSNEAPRNPPDPVPDPVPAPVPDQISADQNSDLDHDRSAESGGPGGSVPLKLEPDSANPKPPRPTRPKTARSALPELWTPGRSESNLAAEEIAKRRGVDLRTELLAMRDWAKSVAERKADWDATWRNWIRRARPTTNGTNGHNGKTAIQRQLERVAMLEEQERKAGIA